MAYVRRKLVELEENEVLLVRFAREIENACSFFFSVFFLILLIIILIPFFLDSIFTNNEITQPLKKII